jgi:hypothetical protein
MVRNEVSPSIYRTRAASVAEFVIYCDFDSVEFATAHRQVMRLVVGVPGDVAVLAGNVPDAGRRRFRFADDRLRRHVAIDVHDIQSSIYVECSVDHRAERLSLGGDG